MMFAARRVLLIHRHLMERVSKKSVSKFMLTSFQFHVCVCVFFWCFF